MSQFQFGNFENRGVGSLFFKNVPISIIFAIFCNIAFIKNLWNSKMSQRSEGGRVNPNWDIVPNFLDFLFWRLPFIFLILDGVWGVFLIQTFLKNRHHPPVFIISKLKFGHLFFSTPPTILFSFSFNLFESWDSFIQHFYIYPPTHQTWPKIHLSQPQLNSLNIT